MAAPTPSVVIVDDHRLFRSGVRVELGNRPSAFDLNKDGGNARLGGAVQTPVLKPS